MAGREAMLRPAEHALLLVEHTSSVSGTDGAACGWKSLLFDHKTAKNPLEAAPAMFPFREQHDWSVPHLVERLRKHKAFPHPDRPHVPLLPRRNGAASSPTWLTTQTRRLCGLCGLTPAEFSAHSLRPGGATDLFAAGKPTAVVQRLGRWTSDTVNIYNRPDARRCIDFALGGTPHLLR